MVHAAFPEPHGAHVESTRHTITPALAAVLAEARHRRGWNLATAAAAIGCVKGTIVHLEKARRAPSAVTAEAIIRAYQLTGAEARMLRAEAIEGAGKDSPYVKNARLFYGKRH